LHVSDRNLLLQCTVYTVHAASCNHWSGFGDVMSRNSPFALLWPLAYTTAYSATPTVSFKNEWQAMNSSCRPRLTRACAAHALSRYRLINATHAYNSSLSHQFQYQWIWSTIIMAVFYVPTGLYLRENGSLYGPISTVLYVYGLSAIMNQLQASHNGPLHCVAKGVHGCSLFLPQETTQA